MSAVSIPDWISSIAAAVGAFAVLFGLLRADKKVDEVLTNARLLKRSEVAENLIALALNVEDAMRDIRNPFDRISADKAGDAKYSYQRRYDRIAKYNEVFENLRSAKIRARAIIGDDDVNSAVEKLFKARSDVAIALETLADYVDDKTFSQDEREHRVELRKTVYGSFSERDELGSEVSKAVDLIEKKLSPFARLETNPK